MSKFEKVPVEEDTVVIFQTEAKMDDLDVLYQKWGWSGIIAESFIFIESDLAKMDDESFEALVRSSPLVKKESQVTITRNRNGFAFANFNFETE